MCSVELSWSVLGFIGFAFRQIGASSPIMSRRNRGDGEALKGSNPSVIKTAQRAFFGSKHRVERGDRAQQPLGIPREKDSNIFCGGEELVAKIAPGNFCSRNYFDPPHDNWKADLSGSSSVPEIRQA
jgi:hypothetical protein